MLLRYASVILCVGLLTACGRSAPNKASAPAELAEVAVPELLYRPGRAENFVVIGDNSIEPEAPPNSQSESGVVIRSRATALNPQGDGNAVDLRISDAARDALSGKTARVTIRARSAATDGSPVYRAFYSRPGVVASGWQEFRPTETFADFSFDFAVPPDTTKAYSSDLVGIWADPEGKGRGIEVSSVRVDIAGVPAG